MANKTLDKKKETPTDHDSALKKESMTYEPEDEEQIISHLQEKMEKSREEIKGILKKL